MRRCEGAKVGRSVGRYVSDLAGRLPVQSRRRHARARRAPTGCRGALLMAAPVVAHEPDADALLHKDLRGVVAVVAHEADAVHEAGVDCRVVLLLFDAAGAMVAPHRWSRAGDLCVRLAYGSHRS